METESMFLFKLFKVSLLKWNQRIKHRQKVMRHTEDRHRLMLTGKQAKQEQEHKKLTDFLYENSGFLSWRLLIFLLSKRGNLLTIKKEAGEGVKIVRSEDSLK